MLLVVQNAVIIHSQGITYECQNLTVLILTKEKLGKDVQMKGIAFAKFGDVRATGNWQKLPMTVA